jgi:hypothetical protein
MALRVAGLVTYSAVRLSHYMSVVSLSLSKAGASGFDRLNLTVYSETQIEDRQPQAA